jgi:hypothetical protein
VSDSRSLRPADVLDRLLGPAGPEITCEECFERLDRYVELELAGRGGDAAIPGMRAHLLGCPACAEDHDSLAELLGAEPDRLGEPGAFAPRRMGIRPMARGMGVGEPRAVARVSHSAPVKDGFLVVFYPHSVCKSRRPMVRAAEIVHTGSRSDVAP